MACLVLTFNAVCLAWVFFRLPVFGEALTCLGRGFVFNTGKMLPGSVADPGLWLLLAVYAVTAEGIRRLAGRIDLGWSGLARRPLIAGLAWGFGSALLFLAVLLSPGGVKPPFIYFQF